MNRTHPKARGRLYLAVFGILMLFGAFQPSAYAQGCVISRGGGFCILHGADDFMKPKQWSANISYRWLYSDRHFVGRKEQTQRQRLGTEVVNDSHFIDVTLTYAATRQLWLNLTLPFVYSDRSSLYEHDRVNRHHTQAGGLADARFSATYWLINPEKYMKGNVALGVGLKAPTGDYEARDTFMRPAGPQKRFVDSSIQPGDGGWGFFLETQGFHQIVGNLATYWNGSYLFNVRERVPTTGFSVPDSYLGRAGFSYLVVPKYGVALTLGGRVEGVPPEDVIGGSRGSRRPGYAISIEPGIAYSKGKISVSVTTPVALERNRQKTFGAATVGDAAFADYTVNASITYRF